MYSPTLMRFLQNDPIGFLAGDPDLYRYEGDNPVNGQDPMGLVDVPAPTKPGEVPRNDFERRCNNGKEFDRDSEDSHALDLGCIGLCMIRLGDTSRVPTRQDGITYWRNYDLALTARQQCLAQGKTPVVFMIDAYPKGATRNGKIVIVPPGPHGVHPGSGNGQSDPSKLSLAGGDAPFFNYTTLHYAPDGTLIFYECMDEGVARDKDYESNRANQHVIVLNDRDPSIRPGQVRVFCVKCMKK